MPLKIPAQSVKVVRDGKPVWAPIGAPFPFTDAEIADIQAVAPGALLAVNVREAEKVVEAARAADEAPAEDSKPAPRKRGRTAAAPAADDDL
jgi:hypothetical protein